jgi:hypothetical protein
MSLKGFGPPRVRGKENETMRPRTRRTWELRETLQRLLAALLLVLGIGGAAAAADVPVTVQVPAESPGIPAYARIAILPPFEEVYHTNDWAAIAFYRQPAGIPKEFNLLEFFDTVPVDEAPRAFAAPLTVEGMEVWAKPPAESPGAAPMVSWLRGLGAVPVWFVGWAELQAAIADQRLTLPELEGLKSLQKGVASFFEETLIPNAGTNLAVEGRGLLDLAAEGRLADGRLFQVHIAGSEEAEQWSRQVSIRFR